MITQEKLRRECAMFYQYGYETAFRNTVDKIKNSYRDCEFIKILIDYLIDDHKKYPGGFMQQKNELDNWVKELTKGIQTEKEKESYQRLSEPKSENENNRLFYRSLHK